MIDIMAILKILSLRHLHKLEGIKIDTSVEVAKG